MSTPLEYWEVIREMVKNRRIVFFAFPPDNRKSYWKYDGENGFLQSDDLKEWEEDSPPVHNDYQIYGLDESLEIEAEFPQEPEDKCPICAHLETMPHRCRQCTSRGSFPIIGTVVACPDYEKQTCPECIHWEDEPFREIPEPHNIIWEGHCKKYHKWINKNDIPCDSWAKAPSKEALSEPDFRPFFVTDELEHLHPEDLAWIQAMELYKKHRSQLDGLQKRVANLESSFINNARTIEEAMSAALSLQYIYKNLIKEMNRIADQYEQRKEQP